MNLSGLSWDTLLAYLLNDRKLSEKESSVAAVKSRYRKLQNYFNELDFNRENFNMFIGDLRSYSYKPSYINNFIKMGKHVDKFLKTNELQDYTYFKENKCWNDDTLTPTEIEQIANLKVKYRIKSEEINARYHALFMLLGTTGCRIDEALSLQRKDVHSSPPFVVFRDTKNDSDRQVPISHVLYEELIAFFGPLVFVSVKNKKLRAQEINIDLKKRAKVLDISKRVYNHLFRHSFITTARESGMDWLDIASIVGHADPKTTMRYSHTSINHFSQAVLVHPLRRSEITFSLLVDKVKQFSERTVDLGKIQPSLVIDEKGVTLTIPRF